MYLLMLTNLWVEDKLAGALEQGETGFAKRINSSIKEMQRHVMEASVWRRRRRRVNFKLHLNDKIQRPKGDIISQRALNTADLKLLGSPLFDR
jgi:hypothetical protein